MEEIKVKLTNPDAKFSLVVSRFNELVTRALLEGCIDELLRLGVREEKIRVVWTPGAFEIPLVAKVCAEDSDAVICLGTIIRGETPHFDFVASETTKGIAQVSLTTDTPVIYGIITADSLEQALDRAGTKLGNRGRDAARSAVEMVNLLHSLKTRS